MKPRTTAALTAASIAATSITLKTTVSATLPLVLLLVVLLVPFATAATGCFLRWYVNLSPARRADVLELIRVLRRSSRT